MNKFERRREIAKRLGPVAGEDAFLEAGFLIEYCKSHIGSDIEELISRRLTGEPMQYVRMDMRPKKASYQELYCGLKMI